MNKNCRKVIVLGAGESGVGAALLAKKYGYEVFVSDSSPISEMRKVQLQEAQIDFETEKHSEEKILNADVIIKSPGIPEKVNLIQKIRQKKIPIYSEIAFAATFTKKPIIAITGTNGKTTTTLLTHHLITQQFTDWAIGGNIGKSFAALVCEDEKYDGYVLEVSSFQLDDLGDFAPHIALLIGITPDHLDRYNYDMAQYAAAKFAITKNQKSTDYFLTHAQDEGILRFETRYPTKAQKRKITIEEDKSLEVYATATHLHFENLLIPKNALPLAGKHNLINSLLAIETARLLNVSYENILRGLASFKNAPHRLEKIGEYEGRTFINDSKATNVDAVAYALESFSSPIIWIAGGIDKGNDYEQLNNAVQKNVKALVCLGIDNQKLIEFFTPQIAKVVDCKNIQEAVEQAYTLSEVGDIILLSPACASFDLFQNYEHRGEAFKQSFFNLRESF
ncbi:MAG: UDP-N-acetylmuramoyl-L-alanine--D-glutamate ligase [Bernardetiaceae bacterium]|nr:UDP-N-acetylmuramoyl-L-alanine--D-glutamate ligase [Bernardetiaceae bacterium]